MHFGDIKSFIGMVIYTIVIAGSGLCKPVPADGNDAAHYKDDVTKPTADSNHTSQMYTTDNTPTTSIPSSTEYISAEVTTLSADDIGQGRLYNFRRLADNLRAGTDSLFNALKTSGESTHYTATLSDYPSIPNYVKEKVKTCTHLQEALQIVFDLVYSYQRRCHPFEVYIINNYPGQRSIFEDILGIEQNLVGLMMALSEFVAFAPVTDQPQGPLEYITVLKTIARLNVESGTMVDVFLQLKHCSSV